MQAYQFITKVTPDGKLSIPAQYTKALSAGDRVQVLVLLAEPQDLDGPSLEEVVAEIQQLPPNPATIEPATGSLADYLANTSNKRKPN